MLIFDGFPTEGDAREFMEAIRVDYGRDTWLFMSQEESDESDEFPYTLTPPIVHVGRYDLSETSMAQQRDLRIEEKIGELVEQFGGRFAGT